VHRCELSIALLSSRVIAGRTCDKAVSLQAVTVHVTLHMSLPALTARVLSLHDGALGAMLLHMKLPQLPHSFAVSLEEARDIQRRLAEWVSCEADVACTDGIRLVAGLDCAYDGDMCHAAAVIWDCERWSVAERAAARVRVDFPYVPGLLSFRELPGLWEALLQLERRPDVLLCDAHGYAHPRRFGLACHIGVLSGIPSVGCAKALLVGQCAEPGPERGARAAIIDGERVGTALRTRTAVKPLYLSVGHRVDLPAAERLVLATAQAFRLPEPLREAHRIARQRAHGP
jgi:deoxyribonuclease V